MLIDTGLRLAELANLRYDPDDAGLFNVDLGSNTVTIVGKSSRIRVVRIGVKAVQALDGYLRARSRHDGETAGGRDCLVLRMRQGLYAPERLVSLSRLPGLRLDRPAVSGRRTSARPSRHRLRRR